MIYIHTIRILPITLPIISKGDNIPSLIIKSLANSDIEIENGDVFIIAHTIISRAEGSEYFLSSLSSNPISEIIGRRTGKDSSLVGLIMKESSKILKIERDIIISEHKLGWISANAAVDQSNSKPGCAITIPINPDMHAKKIGKALSNHYGVDISLLISDTHGRALRRGAINVAIGAYNFAVIDDVREREDIFGYKMKSTIIGLADEVCSAAELIMGQANEKIPVVLIKGVKQKSKASSVKELLYPPEKRLFR